MDQSAPKTLCLPSVWYPEKEPRGPKLSGEELPNTPKPSQKEGEAGSTSPLEKPPLHSHHPIPKASKASGIRDWEQAMLVQGVPQGCKAPKAKQE